MNTQSAINHLNGVDGQWIVSKAADFVMQGCDMQTAVHKAVQAYNDFCVEMIEKNTDRAKLAYEVAATRVYNHFN